MRIWNLRLNLDELNAINLVGLSESIRSDLWTGLVYGCNGLELPEGASKHLQATFELGSAWRQEAEAHSERMSQGGRSSVESRRAKHGTAQPSKLVRTSLELPPEGSPNQSNIEYLESINNNPETEKASSPQGARPPRQRKSVSSIPDEFLKDLNVLCEDWPSKFVGSDGKVQPLRNWSDPADLWEAMGKYFPQDDKALMIKCGLVYLDQIMPPPEPGDLRPPKPPAFCAAMRNFYGPQKAYWKNHKAAARERMEERNDDNQP